jgi:hypothetical protein
MSDLNQAIAEANKRAGLSRQKIYAKKSYLRQTDAQVIEMLCTRMEELIAAGKAQVPKVVYPALAEAVAVARRQQGAKR